MSRMMQIQMVVCQGCMLSGVFYLSKYSTCCVGFGWNKQFFYRQLDFPSKPEFANEILENEAKSCLAVA